MEKIKITAYISTKNRYDTTFAYGFKRNSKSNIFTL